MLNYHPHLAAMMSFFGHFVYLTQEERKSYSRSLELKKKILDIEKQVE